MRWPTFALAASLFAALTAPAPVRAAPPPRPAEKGRLDVHAELLADGTELILLRIRSAARASLRYVVRAGSAFDPPRKDGLAHLVEHVIASARDGSERLLDEAGAAGGVMNAFTSRDATWYALDAPVESFPRLARKLLSAVTDPGFEQAEVNAVSGVVESEQQISDGGGFLSAVDAALFPEPTGTVLGSVGTREGVTRDDMLAFYRTRYVTNVTTVILAGDFTPEAARELVEGSTALPPALPTERFDPRRTSASLPTEQEVRAPFHAVVIGFQVDEADWGTCQAAAELVNVRLTYHYELKRPVIAWSDVGCHRLRGVPFLLTAAFARSLDEESLPEIIDSIYKNAAARPMTELERKILDQRRSRSVDWLRDSPQRAAEAATALAIAPRESGTTPVGLLGAPLPTQAELRAFARRTYVRERRLNLTFAPY